MGCVFDNPGELMRLLRLFALLLPIPVLAVAQPRVELGRVELTVPDRTASARRDALREGLDRVLIRLTGLTDPAQRASLDRLRSGDPARWVSQYSYRDADEEKPRQGSQEGEAKPRLRARFDVSGLLDELGQRNAPVWDENRPALLVWLVVQEPTSGELVARGSDHRVRALLEEAARRRGLPIVWPRMDSEDRSVIQPADIRGRFDQPVQQASARYDAPLVATAVLYRSDSPRLRWRLLDSGQERTGSTLTMTGLEEGLRNWVSRVTDYLVDLYAVRGQKAGTINLRVRGLSQLQHWNRLQDFLRGLAGMRSVQLRQLEGETAVFRARFAGPATKLERLAKLEPALGSCQDDRALAAVSASSDETPSTSAGGATPAVKPESTVEFCWDGS
jgi:hypothetical protein